MPRNRDAKRRGVALRTDLADAAIRVDREAGVIYGVAVLTVGPTKVSANGVGPFDVDAVALQAVADAINASEIGVKSRITHPEIDGVDDLTVRLGYVRNARVVGDAVRADMHFHDPESTHAVTLMDIAEQDPASCGLSLVSATATLEPADTPTGLVMRLDAVDAVDWVGEPAANPAGMLSARRTKNTQLNRRPFRGLHLQELVMTEKQKEFLHSIGLPWDATEEQVAAFIEALSDEQKAQFAALKDDPAVEAAAEAAEAEGEASGGGGDGEGAVAAAADDEDDEDETSSGMTASTRRGKKPRTAAASGGTSGGGVALTREQVRQELRRERQAERARVSEIRQIALRCGFDEKWIEKHIDGETPIGEVRRVALAGLKRSPQDMHTSQVSVGSDLNRDTLAAAVQDAILLRAGVRQLCQFDAEGGVALSADRRPQVRKPHERSAQFRGHSLIEMGRRYLLALGYRQADSLSKIKLADLLMSRTKLASALGGVYLAQSTGDFPNLLADAMGKVLRQAYALAPHTWSRWCNRTTAPDFKDIKKLQLSEAADLVQIPEGDEYEYGVLTESKEVYALSTYGKGIKFTRQALINDDLAAFNRVPVMLGNAAARKVEGLAIAILTANAQLADSVALFATAHANLATGTLTVANLGAARALMRKQTALGSDDPLELLPRYLLVPETLFITASQLVSSTVDPAKSNATPNPFANQLEVISSPRLDSDSTAQWYLAASPSDIDTVDVCFLEGEETPVVEEEDEFDTDARKLKVRHNIVAKAIDYRGLVRSNGSD